MAASSVPLWQRLTSELTQSLYEDGPPKALSELFKSRDRRALGTDVMTSLRCILELLPKHPRSNLRFKKLLAKVKTFPELESAIAEFRQLSRGMSSIDKLKSSDPFSRPLTKSSPTSAQDSITKERILSKCSLESRRAVSATLPSLTEIVSVDSESNLSNISSLPTVALSQCSTKLLRYQMSKSSQGILWTSCTSSPLEVTGAEASQRKPRVKAIKSKGVTLVPETEENQKTCRVLLKIGQNKGKECGAKTADTGGRCKQHLRSVLEEEEGILRSSRFRVHATIAMRKLLPQWFGCCRIVYNRCVDLDKEMNLSGTELKKRLVTGEHSEEWMNECPNHLRSEVIRDYVGGRDGALTLYKKKLFLYNKKIERWEQGGKRWKKPLEPKKPVMKHRTKRAVRQVIHITKTDITANNLGFNLQYTQFIKELCKPSSSKRKRRANNSLLAVNSSTNRKDKNLRYLLENGNIKHDVRLIRYRDGRLYLEVPIDTQVKDLPVTEKAVGIDPGLRTPLVCAGSDGTIFEMGTKFKENIKKLREERSHLQSLGSKDNRMSRLNSKITNTRTQFHYEAARELQKYQHVYLPKINYSGWNSGLARASRRDCQEIAHPLFRNRLIAKSEILGSGRVVHNCDEYMTTKVCGVCFHVNDNIGSKEVFDCPACKCSFGRDHNAARNILLTNLC